MQSDIDCFSEGILIESKAGRNIATLGYKGQRINKIMHTDRKAAESDKTGTVYKDKCFEIYTINNRPSK